MNEPVRNGDDRAGHRWPDPIVVSRPGAVLQTQIIPLDDEWRKALTADVEYLKPPRLPRPANLRWWERLAYAWRGL